MKRKKRTISFLITIMVMLSVALCSIDGVAAVKQEKLDPKKPMIALTFDDGPGNRTGELLDVLEKYNARATFFVLGSRLNTTKARKNLKKMEAIGCEIGNHTASHKSLSSLSAKKIKKEILSVDKKVKKYTGHKPKVLRPPYGAGTKNATVRKHVGKPMIYWSIDTLDWKTKSKKKTVKTVMKNVKDGDIILMHDIHSTSVDAAIELIPKLIKKGYQLVTVSELANARGVKLKNGKTYYSFRPSK